MSVHIVDTMLPDDQGKINELSLAAWRYFEFAFNANLHIDYFFSAMDGDQLVDFYWIDPMLTAELIAGKTKYAGNLYLQFEIEK